MRSTPGKRLKPLRILREEEGPSVKRGLRMEEKKFFTQLDDKLKDMEMQFVIGRSGEGQELSMAEISRKIAKNAESTFLGHKENAKL